MGDIGQGEDGVEGQKTPVTPQGATASYPLTSSLLGPGESWSLLDRWPLVEGQDLGVCLPTAACQGPVSKN